MTEPSRRIFEAGTRVLVVLPTFNEIDSLPRVIDEVIAAVPETEILVVDDASPDGTGEWAEQRRRELPQLHVLHRPRKLGLGSAYKAGFAWGLAHDFDALVEMDSDGSHPPAALPSLLGALEAGADLVLGSRYVLGGSTPGWARHRLLLSRTSNALTRQLLDLPVRDATAGYRAYWANTLRAIDVGSVASDGYAFQVETLWRTLRAGLCVVEWPIAFRERQAGASKDQSSGGLPGRPHAAAASSRGAAILGGRAQVAARGGPGMTSNPLYPRAFTSCELRALSNHRVSLAQVSAATAAVTGVLPC